MQGQSSPVQAKDPYTGSILMHVGSFYLLILSRSISDHHLRCSVRFGSATRTQNFEREVFFYYFSNFPLFLFVKLPDFRSRSLGPAISHCWSLFSPKLRV